MEERCRTFSENPSYQLDSAEASFKYNTQIHFTGWCRGTMTGLEVAKEDGCGIELLNKFWHCAEKIHQRSSPAVEVARIVED